MKSKIRSIVSIFLAVIMIFALNGCKAKEVDVDTSSSSAETSQPAINPFTGLEMDKAAVNQRPVAIMINNISIAQEVQTGLNNADIVYEAYAEGGITRLLAVYKDVSKVGNIGTVRSARYSYAELAFGHDAIYVHAGANKYAIPYMKKLGMDNFNLNSGKPSNYGFRVKNGKASEHTLYTTGEKLNEGFENLNYRRDLNSASASWQSFSATAVVPAEGSCEEVFVKMSGASNTTFKYNAETGRYTRYSGSTERKDYNTGESVTFKNVLVLKTDVTPMDSANSTVKTELEGGDGYYISNGGYQSIKWSKGAASNPLKITMADGSECAYNTGNTWVCLMDKENTVTITPAADATASN